MNATATPQIDRNFNAHNGQAFSAAETLTHLDALIATGEQIDERKRDTRVSASTLRSVGGQLSYPTGDAALFASAATAPTPLTDHAWSQLIDKLSATGYFGKGVPRLDLIATDEYEAEDQPNGNGHLPKRWLKAVPTDLLDLVLNYYFEHAPQDRAWWLRSIATPDHTAEHIRAVLGARYPIHYGNTALLKDLHAIIAKHADNFPQINLIRPAIGDNDLQTRVMYYQRDTDDGPYGVGFHLGNSEVARGYYDIHMAIQRHACTNSIIADSRNCIHVLHFGTTPTVREQIFNAMGVALKLGDTLLDEFLETREVAIPDFDDVLDGLHLRYGRLLTDPIVGIAKEAARAQGGDTKFGLINGITWAAHQAQDVQPRDRAELERLGGALIAAPDSLFAQAARAAKAARAGDEPALNFGVTLHYTNATDADEA